MRDGGTGERRNGGTGERRDGGTEERGNEGTGERRDGGIRNQPSLKLRLTGEEGKNQKSGQGTATIKNSTLRIENLKRSGTKEQGNGGVH